MLHLFFVLLLAFAGQVPRKPGQDRLQELRDSTRIDLKVVDPQFDPIDGRITFALRNDGSVPVEYIILRYEGVYPDGRRTWWTFSEPVEDALTASGERHRFKLLGPGESLQKSMGTPSKEGVELAEADVRVQAVIYSDLSFQGDAKAADGFFRQREKLQLVRSVWIDRLSRIRQQAGDAALLRKALHEFQTGMEVGGDIVSNDRVSTQEVEARSYSSKVLGGRLERLLQADDDSLWERFENFLLALEEGFERGKASVTHDLRGIRIQR